MISSITSISSVSTDEVIPVAVVRDLPMYMYIDVDVSMRSRVVKTTVTACFGVLRQLEVSASWYLG